MALSLLIAGTPGLPLIGLVFVTPVVVVLLTAAYWIRGSRQSFLSNLIVGTLGTIVTCLTVMKWGDAYPSGLIERHFFLFFWSGAILGACSGPAMYALFCRFFVGLIAI